MSKRSLRADGWQNAAALLVMAILVVCFWYINDFYLNWIVFGVGTGAGVVIYKIFNFSEKNTAAGFPIVMVMIIAINAALLIQSLVPGVVAALTVTTAIKEYEVYLT